MPKKKTYKEMMAEIINTNTKKDKHKIKNVTGGGTPPKLVKI